MGAASVDHERVRLHGRGGVVQRVRVLRGLALQLALVGEGAGAAVAEKSGIHFIIQFCLNYNYYLFILFTLCIIVTLNYDILE